MKNILSPRKLACILVGACLSLSPAALLAVNPPPDGGYPNGNTAEGEDALFSLRTGVGVNHTAVGYHALYAQTTGAGDTAVGYQALASNTGASFNTAVGNFALSLNTAGSSNTAVGSGALQKNTTGLLNTAIGTAASASNTTASNNIAIGAYVLDSNNSSGVNIAIGTNTLHGHVQGDQNVAVGHFAMNSNSSGSNNVALGNGALSGDGGSNNVAVGYNALNRSFGEASKNIAVGYQAGMAIQQGSNNIDIGDVGVATDQNTTRIGNVKTANTYIAGISGVTVAGGVGVVVDNTGHLGTTVSSARYKQQVKPMEKASEAILSLQPVTFRYHKELDPAGVPQFGLVAEEVEKVNPDLVARDEQGKPYTVRYEAVNTMLLNEFLKEHRRVEQQSSHITS